MRSMQGRRFDLDQDFEPARDPLIDFSRGFFRAAQQP
jgi:hypothetical protein